MDKNFNQLKRQEKEAFFMLPIITEIKRLGGQTTTKELKKSIVANCKDIPEDVFTSSKVSRNGNLYLENMYPFNFSVTSLVMAGYMDRPHPGQLVLTKKGRQFNGSAQELVDDVHKLSSPIWAERSKKNKQRKERQQQLEKENDDNEGWRTKLLMALENLTPAKFELFCRALVKKMNVDIDENIGVKLSGDGGLDGFGYMTTDDFRTTRVAIQAKKWNSDHLVSSPEVDKFRGAMDKYQAEYGIFITTSSYTRDAIQSSRIGTRVITLVDGTRLTDLIAKYELYVTPVVTYELGEFFTDDN
ncbi:restriction endonuclease [Limosilactobacillus fermentum]|uniref:restriction endonuclease n=1 Tax=Limosilactobacillus fermentum TaxID=1613 RepID=UPI000E470A3B|nr:restriction endonuclease [Limosilactobacillus fermentum]MCH5383674.1 Mrr restriction system protein [Limosilactobacillus fermentum]RGU86279.1 Mrr restriction system protein [Limosilactobacillus fermentum]